MNPTRSLSVGDLSPPHIFRDTTVSLAQVSCEHDHFIDNDHRPLDAKLMKHFSAFRKINKEPDLPALLSCITVGDKRLVTLTEEEAEEDSTFMVIYPLSPKYT
jgi:hypothetical protein